ncbi:MAG: sialidase family protein [Candidatus Hydrogenedens sp.]
MKNHYFKLHFFSISIILFTSLSYAGEENLIRAIEPSCAFNYDGDDFCWFHPRVATIPVISSKGYPRVLMTLQKHLMVSDYYSGMFFSYTDDGGKTWAEPQPVPELDWVKDERGHIVSVCDVTPGWHPQTKKYIAIGIRLRYDDNGHQVREDKGCLEGAYAIYDPEKNLWTKWQTLDLGGDLKDAFSIMPGCTQWIIEPDGTILLPIYFAKNKEDNNKNYSITVLHIKFDGEKLIYLKNGNIITHEVPRGMCEPSLAKYKGKYYLTIRNDERGYVTWSNDGLHYEPIQPWLFDDGIELGSYNTQQHWAVHSDGLFLVYTRKGANNDHIIRHRAPLFIAQVNTDNDQIYVIRKTEQIVLPERGATMGNFGVSAVSPEETWVTVGEGMFSKDAKQCGAKGCVLVGRIIWSKPNQQVSPYLPSFPK